MFVKRYIMKKRRELLSPDRWRRLPPLFCFVHKDVCYFTRTDSPFYKKEEPMHFRYKYEHLDCAYCADLEGKYYRPALFLIQRWDLECVA